MPVVGGAAQPLGWVLPAVYGDTHYRFEAVRGLVKHRRRQNLKFIVHVAVRWANIDVWSMHRDVQLWLAAVQSQPGWYERLDYERYHRKGRDLETAIMALPTLHYLVSGIARTTQIACERVTPSQEGFGARRDIDPRDAIAYSLHVRRQTQNWATMTEADCNRCLRNAERFLRRQITFDKLASSEWPATPVINIR